MRSDLVFKFTSKGDMYKAVPVFNDTTGETEVTYVFNETTPCYVIQGINGIFLTSRTKYDRFSTVRNLVDRYGVTMLPADQYYVTDVWPQVDFTGAVVAWKHVLRPDLPRDYSKEIKAMLEAASS